MENVAFENEGKYNLRERTRHIEINIPRAHMKETFNLLEGICPSTLFPQPHVESQ